MQRDGADPENMRPEDFLCDYCGQHWADDRPMVEGHQGSLICGRCLTIAYTELVLHNQDAAHAGAKCVLCLEERDDPMWQSPVRDDVFACTRCCKQAAGRMHKDPDTNWRRPERPAQA